MLKTAIFETPHTVWPVGGGLEVDYFAIFFLHRFLGVSGRGFGPFLAILGVPIWIEKTTKTGLQKRVKNIPLEALQEGGGLAP